MTTAMKIIETLALYTATEFGVTRLPFTPEGGKAKDYLVDYMMGLGLEVMTDDYGNVMGRLKGRDAQKKKIIIGSHYDTVIEGGKYDGVLGIAVGVHVIETIIKSGYKPEHDLVILATNDEEGVRFGNGFLGSRGLLGQVDRQELEGMKDNDGISIHEAMERAATYDHCDTKLRGIDKASVDKSRWLINQETTACFVEVHIEQGPVLHEQSVDIGVVEGIVGMKRFMFTVYGESNHAGTTPMELRRDAVECASKMIAVVSDGARAQTCKTVATVGYMQVRPNAINVVAGEVSFGVDIRSMDTEAIDNVLHLIVEKAEEVKASYGITYTIEEKLVVEATKLDAGLIEACRTSCDENKVSYMNMTSGAGHDALAIAPHIPTCMLFVPSRDGISHHPKEYTDEEYINRAIQVTDTLIRKIDGVI